MCQCEQRATCPIQAYLYPAPKRSIRVERPPSIQNAFVSGENSLYTTRGGNQRVSEKYISYRYACDAYRDTSASRPIKGAHYTSFSASVPDTRFAAGCRMAQCTSLQELWNYQDEATAVLASKEADGTLTKLEAKRRRKALTKEVNVHTARLSSGTPHVGENNTVTLQGKEVAMHAAPKGGRSRGTPSMVGSSAASEEGGDEDGEADSANVDEDEGEEEEEEEQLPKSARAKAASAARPAQPKQPPPQMKQTFGTKTWSAICTTEVGKYKSQFEGRCALAAPLARTLPPCFPPPRRRRRIRARPSGPTAGSSRRAGPIQRFPPSLPLYLKMPPM